MVSDRKVSVIVTCYNEGFLLKRAVLSLMNQTIKNFEIIIVKDLSVHSETIEVCKELEKKGYIVLWSNANIGVSGTRNMGIEKAKGEIIYTFDADDELPSDAVELVIKAFQSNQDAEIIFGNYKLYDDESLESLVVDCSEYADENAELIVSKFFEKSLIYGNSPFLKTAWKKVGGYSMEYTFGCQDYEFQIRLMKAGCKFKYIDNILYLWYRKITGINSSYQNKLSYDKCWYEHMDFIINFKKEYKYFMYLCKYFKNEKKYRLLFRLIANNSNRTFLVLFEPYIPFYVLKKISRYL